MPYDIPGAELELPGSMMLKDVLLLAAILVFVVAVTAIAMILIA